MGRMTHVYIELPTTTTLQQQQSHFYPISSSTYYNYSRDATLPTSSWATTATNQTTIQTKNTKTTFLAPTPTSRALSPMKFAKKKCVVPMAVATTSPSKQDNLFIYFSLSTNKLDGLQYAPANEDDCGIDDKAERITCFSMEFHPLHNAMFGTLLPGLQDDPGVRSDLIPHALHQIFS